MTDLTELSDEVLLYQLILLAQRGETAEKMKPIETEILNRMYQDPRKRKTA